MRVVVAPDSFKESLSAVEAADAIAAGVREAGRDAQIDLCPMADGGEGTVEAMVAASGGAFRTADVFGPLGEPRQARFGILGDGATAVIEMAAAAGLALVPPEERNPLLTTTFGVGCLMRAALDAGARNMVIGIGGSATVDGGTGCARRWAWSLSARPARPGRAGLPAGGWRISAGSTSPTATRGSRTAASASPATWPTR